MINFSDPTVQAALTEAYWDGQVDGTVATTSAFHDGQMKVSRNPDKDVDAWAPVIDAAALIIIDAASAPAHDHAAHLLRQVDALAAYLDAPAKVRQRIRTAASTAHKPIQFPTQHMEAS